MFDPALRRQHPVMYSILMQRACRVVAQEARVTVYVKQLAGQFCSMRRARWLDNRWAETSCIDDSARCLHRGQGASIRSGIRVAWRAGRDRLRGHCRRR